jgi:hypothetical protein
VVERCDPEAVLRQKAQEWLRALHPKPRATIDLIIYDSKQATRGQCIEAVAKMKDVVADTDKQGH